MSAYLYVIHHSPWSERARWALDHHRLPFQEREHVPLVGELALRFRAKRWRGKVSVPLLVDSTTGQHVQGSFAIAEHADSLAPDNKPLVSPEARGELLALDAALEPALDAARARFVRDLAGDRDARLESLPSWMRLPVVGSPSARLGAWFIARKYGSSFDGVDERLRAGLSLVRQKLGGRRHVKGELGWADVLCASVVQAVVPLPARFLDVPPATRRLWRHEQLAREFADLVAWRDALYDESRAA